MLWIALHLPALSLESWAATLADPSGLSNPACGTAGPPSGPSSPDISTGISTGISPSTAPRPLALLHEHRVRQANALAQAQGVRPGMKRATALALAPDLLLGQACDRRDALALRAVAHVALAFSPSVSWATPAGWRVAAAKPGTATPTPLAPQADDDGAPPNPAPSPALVGVRLEVQASLRFFGGLPALLQRLRAQLAPLGHRVHIATAPTALGAALLAAWRDDLALGPHSTPGPAQPNRPNRPNGQNDPNGPNGPQALHHLLDQLPLPLLAPGREQGQALQAMGLARLGDLARLPRAGLARRFSPALLTDIDRARGLAPDAHTWLNLPQSFASRLELFARADTSAQVLAGAQVLLARLVAWAQARQGRIVRFELVMHHEPRHRHDSLAPERSTLAINPAQPSADATHLHSLLAERLGRLPLPAPALELSLLCSALAAGGPPNAELFTSPGSQHEGLARLVERLQARLGQAQVQCLQAVADHRPEHATRWWPADAARLGQAGPGAPAHPPTHTTAHTTAQPMAHNGLSAPQPFRSLPVQPLWLLPEPQALPLHEGQPLLHGRPLQLLAGPDRLETGWWDGHLALRDYFVAQAHDGALVWLYHHRLPSGEAAVPAWYLQGLFA